MQDIILQQQRILWKSIAVMRRKNDEFIMAWFASVGERLIARAGIIDGMRVLDAATGTGEPGLTIAQRFPSVKVIGLDNSEEMAAIAREKAAQRGVKNFQVMVGDAGKLPFDDSSFDAVLCRHGVMFFPDIVKYLQEFLRVLRAGHIAVASAWGSFEENPWASLFREVFMRYTNVSQEGPEHIGRFRCAQPDLLKQLFIEAGFHNVVQEEVHGMLTFSSSEEAWNILTHTSVNNFKIFESLSADIQPRVRREIVERMERYRMHKGISFPWHAWVAWGTK